MTSKTPLGMPDLLAANAQAASLALFEAALAATEPAPAPALLLAAGLTAAQALPLVTSSTAAHVVVRRVEGLVVFWYVMPLDWVRDRVQAAAPDEPLRRVLNLHENGAAPVRSATTDAVAEAPERDSVVLDEGRLVGVRLAAGPLQAAQAPGLDVAGGRGFAFQSDGGVDLGVPQRHAPAAPPEASARPTRAARATRSLRREAAADDAADASAAPPLEAQPFSAFPRLEAPDRVEPGQSFTVLVGLAEARQRGVSGGPVRVALADSVSTFELEVQLVVDGFSAPQGLKARLPVDRAAPARDQVRFTLVAPALGPGEEARLNMLRVLFFFDGQYCGNAARAIAIVPADRQPLDYDPGQGQVWTQPQTAGEAAPLSVVPGLPPVDLTIAIDKLDGADQGGGRYVWSFCSPLTDQLPSASVPMQTGADGPELGGKIISEVQAAGALGLPSLLIEGLGRSIRDAAPPELWPALRAVQQALQAAGVTRLPNVLLLTAEPHIPWELALLEEPEKLDPAAPPLLGCQVNLGRWPLGRNEPAPRGAVEIRHMAAVVGDYAARSGWRKLDEAVKEGQALISRYQAVKLEADAAQIKQLLMARLGVEASGAGAPGHGAEAVHFACHGDATANHVLDAAIILGNGARLAPIYLANAPLGKVSSPFLFMNACQVGKAGELLASFSGFAGEAIKGGFRGFLGPLWSVEDALARDIALGFYEQVFGGAGQPPRPVAAVLREMRARFSDDEPNSLTRLAYVFYGHPGLTLTRAPAPQPAAAPQTTAEPQP